MKKRSILFSYYYFLFFLFLMQMPNCFAQGVFTDFHYNLIDELDGVKDYTYDYITAANNLMNIYNLNQNDNLVEETVVTCPELSVSEINRKIKQSLDNMYKMVNEIEEIENSRKSSTNEFKCDIIVALYEKEWKRKGFLVSQCPVHLEIAIKPGRFKVRLTCKEYYYNVLDLNNQIRTKAKYQIKDTYPFSNNYEKKKNYKERGAKSYLRCYTYSQYIISVLTESMLTQEKQENREIKMIEEDNW